MWLAPAPLASEIGSNPSVATPAPGGKHRNYDSGILTEASPLSIMAVCHGPSAGGGAFAGRNGVISLMAAEAGTGRIEAGSGVQQVARVHREGVFESVPSSVPQLREFLRGELDGFPALFEVTLCASELATNAIKHGSERGTRFSVTVQRNDSLVYVAVTDCGGSTEPVMRSATVDDEQFRGLALVNLYATAWDSVRTKDGGHRVWFEVVSD